MSADHVIERRLVGANHLAGGIEVVAAGPAMRPRASATPAALDSWTPWNGEGMDCAAGADTPSRTSDRTRAASRHMARPFYG
jgi:hypothetical protein